MATNTPLQSILLTSSASTVTFSNIDQKYTDLVLVASTRSLVNGTNDALFIQINGDSSALYSRTEMYNSGGGRASSETSFRYHGKTAGATSNAGTFGTSTINFMNYSNSTTFKTLIARCGMTDSTYSEIKMSVGLYRSTNAITSMSITSESGTSFVAGSTFELYGISPVAANTAQAFGGTEILYDSTYVYHVFKSSGIFTPYRNLTADYLVVAGGGAGGTADDGGGGGGAGGLRSTITTTGGGGSLESALSLTANTNYTVTIGAGGAGVQGESYGSTAGRGNNGSNSVFSTITSTGGGGGGGYTPGGAQVGSSGGSGGGGGQRGSSAGGAGTANQGYAGGSTGSAGDAGGGGGGAGGAGTNASAGNVGGNGGNGVAISIAGSSISYAGGGGGGGASGQGTAGAGGGVAPGLSGNGGNATTNLGGGGGACNAHASFSGSGGSGIVIVRYAR